MGYGKHYKLSPLRFGCLDPINLFFCPHNVAFENEILDFHSFKIFFWKLRIEPTSFLLHVSFNNPYCPQGNDPLAEKDKHDVGKRGKKKSTLKYFNMLS